MNVLLNERCNDRGQSPVAVVMKRWSVARRKGSDAARPRLGNANSGQGCVWIGGRQAQMDGQIRRSI